MTFDLAAFAQYGIAGVFAAGLLYVLWRVGNQLVKALEGLVKTVSDHTAKDSLDHAETREVIARIDGKLDGILDERERTPVGVEIPSRRTPPQGVPAGYYGPARPGTRGGDR